MFRDFLQMEDEHIINHCEDMYYTGNDEDAINEWIDPDIPF